MQAEQKPELHTLRKRTETSHSRFVDAARYPGRQKRAVAAVTDYLGREITSASTRNATIVEAEEIEIALAIKATEPNQQHITLISDSHAACRSYLRGRVCTAAYRIIRDIKPRGQISPFMGTQS